MILYRISVLGTFNSRFFPNHSHPNHQLQKQFQNQFKFFTNFVFYRGWSLLNEVLLATTWDFIM